MDEKIIIKSEHYTGKKTKKILRLIGWLLTLFFLIGTTSALISSTVDHYEWLEETHEEHTGENGYCWRNCYACQSFENYASASDYYITDLVDNWSMYLAYFVVCFVPLVLFTFIAWIIKRYLNSFEMTVTDKRIYGKIKWGRRVDLPIDSVSAVGIGAFKSITISTSSGRISFSAIRNRNEIHEIVSKLLVERQKQSAIPVAPTATSPLASSADELKKYKELLDCGIITQEEFDAKKKQLLGL